MLAAIGFDVYLGPAQILASPRQFAPQPSRRLAARIDLPRQILL
ncbi:hypothetical protein [Roseomonas mucosa]